MTKSPVALDVVDEARYIAAVVVTRAFDVRVAFGVFPPVSGAGAHHVVYRAVAGAGVATVASANVAETTEAGCYDFYCDGRQLAIRRRRPLRVVHSILRRK